MNLHQLKKKNNANVSKSTCEFLPVSLNFPPYICYLYIIHTYV